MRIAIIQKLLTGICILQLVFGVTQAQQDAQFSQYMFNGIYINPAYAGYREQLNLHAFYRNQWNGITGAPRTMSVAIDAIANDDNVGLALQLSSDRLGAQHNQSIYASYAYRLRTNETGTSRLALGIGMGAIQLGIDGSMLNPNDPEPNQPAGMQSTIVPDARAGVYYSNDRFYAGVSFDNLISQYINLDEYLFLPNPKLHCYLTAGALFPLSEHFTLKPSFLLKDDLGGPTSLDINAFLIVADKVWLGGSYRTGVKLYNKDHLPIGLSNQNSAVVATQIFATSNIRIGYAYDISVGPLQRYSGGTHEISVSYFFNRRNERIVNPRYF
jgi:type IX secretion system PorP/SprF family membrane protein